MRQPFDKLIQSLQREVLDLKSAKKLATSSLKTTTKSISGTAVIRSYGGTDIAVTKAILVTINTPDGLPAPFSVAISNRLGWRGFYITNYNVPDAAGFLLIPRPRTSLDGDMTAGESKNVSVTVDVTSTNDITLSATQVDFEDY